MKKIQFRKTQKMVNGNWIGCEFEELKKGDRFRLFEPDGTLVRDKESNYLFLATSNPWSVGHGNYSIASEVDKTK